MDSLFELLTCVAILLVKMLIWPPFSQSVSTFSFYINPCLLVCWNQISIAEYMRCQLITTRHFDFSHRNQACVYQCKTRKRCGRSTKKYKTVRKLNCRMLAWACE